MAKKWEVEHTTAMKERKKEIKRRRKKVRSEKEATAQ